MRLLVSAPGGSSWRDPPGSGWSTGASKWTVEQRKAHLRPAVCRRVHDGDGAEDFILAIVELTDDTMHRVHYVRHPFRREPDFGVTSVHYDFGELLARADLLS